MTNSLWRALRDGLSSLWDRAATRLAALRFNPSRFDHLAKLPNPMLVKEIAQFAVDHRAPDLLAVAELAARWGYMNGQCDARDDLLKIR